MKKILIGWGRYHGSGENRSRATRQALNFAYALSFLKQEMNTFVGVPPLIARELPPLIAELAGYAASERRWLCAGGSGASSKL